MLKSGSIFALLAAAAVGVTPILGLNGCYPRDYDPATPEIDAPSTEQIEHVAATAQEVTRIATVAAGQPAWIPILDLAARLAVLIGAWFVARTYPKKEPVDAPKESKQ